jgi:hypothetical protein
MVLISIFVTQYPYSQLLVVIAMIWFFLGMALQEKL